jgi:predicted DNA-binding transcriptional regulator AlpA
VTLNAAMRARLRVPGCAVNLLKPTATFAKKAAAAQTASAQNVALPVRLLDKRDIRSITHVTFPTIWAWMRAGTFPRSRVVGGKSMWLSSEIDAWLADLPVRALKGDAEVEVSMPPHVQKPGAGDGSESAP